jgi:hypothetical protein
MHCIKLRIAKNITSTKRRPLPAPRPPPSSLQAHPSSPLPPSDRVEPPISHTMAPKVAIVFVRLFPCQLESLHRCLDDRASPHTDIATTSTPCMAMSRHWPRPRRRELRLQVELWTSTSKPSSPFPPSYPGTGLFRAPPRPDIKSSQGCRDAPRGGPE